MKDEKVAGLMTEAADKEYFQPSYFILHPSIFNLSLKRSAPDHWELKLIGFSASIPLVEEKQTVLLAKEY
jgi:hypothetical protein